MSLPESVELSPAYVWDCPECGRENLQRAISFFPTEDQKANDPDFAKAAESGFDGYYTTRPESVVCRHPDCGKRFKAIDVNSDDE
jgi:hypothetical protein